jgi:hypothetical protein
MFFLLPHTYKKWPIDGGQQRSGWNRSEEAPAFAFIPGF